MREFKNRQSSKSWIKKIKRKKISFSFGFLKKIINAKTLTAVIILLLLPLLFYFFAFSNYFGINNIIISGNDTISKVNAEQIVRNELSAKIYKFIPGNNYFFINTDLLAKKLAESFPEIENVMITKKFPNVLYIRINEKRPALIWCRNSCFFVNDQGVAYLPASEEDLNNQNKHFIKIIEQLSIPEENSDGSPDISDSQSQTNIITPASAANQGQHSINPSAIQLDAPKSETTASISGAIAVLPDIVINNKVSDESFIKFTLDVNDILSHNAKLKIIYYKTKGTKSRELIAFTDKNTRIYFDATQPAKTQTDNLDYFLEKGIDKEKIDSLKYIYLKNNDRVFYK
jgi:hypothetical protein